MDGFDSGWRERFQRHWRAMMVADRAGGVFWWWAVVATGFVLVAVGLLVGVLVWQAVTGPPGSRAPSVVFAVVFAAAGGLLVRLLARARREHAGRGRGGR